MRMRQVMTNLLTNAIRHSPAHTTVSVRAWFDDEAIRIAVSDQGEGIEPADADRVFDRFWRADKSRSRESGGSGLGLAIVRRLVVAHGGSVAVASRRGVGSSFVISLPRTPRAQSHRRRYLQGHTSPL